MELTSHRDSLNFPKRLETVPLEALSDTAKPVQCPSCRKIAVTRVQLESSTSTHFAAALCCLLCGICCVAIPYWKNWYKSVDHYCSLCGVQLTHKQHDGRVEVVVVAKAPLVEKPRTVIEARPGASSGHNLSSYGDQHIESTEQENGITLLPVVDATQPMKEGLAQNPQIAHHDTEANESNSFPPAPIRDAPHPVPNAHDGSPDTTKKLKD